LIGDVLAHLAISV